MIRRDNILPLFLLLFPLIWGMGVSFVAVQVLAALILLAGRVKVHLAPPMLVPIYFGIFLYTGSLVVNFPLVPVERIVASAYNLSFWICGLLIALQACRSTSNLAVNRLSYISRRYLLVLVLLTVFLYFSGIGLLSIKTPAAYIFGGAGVPELISDSIVLNIISQDWFFGGAKPRYAFLSPYANAYGACVFLLFALATYRVNVFSRAYFFTSLMAIALVLSSNSRLLLVMFILLVFGSVYLVLDRRGRILLLLVALASCPIFLLLWFDGVLLEYWLGFVNSREGSNSLRFESYARAIAQTWELNPLLGIGVKPRDELGIPLGSHSTLLGTFVKSGVLGLIVFGVFVAKLQARAMRRMWRVERDTSGARLQLALAIFCLFFLFEDIDAPQLACFLFFCLLGLSIRQSLLCENGDNNKSESNESNTRFAVSP
ncbi:O-antigen ligase [Microbulbifer sp. ALW1]|uniref:O-antigen ligase family protein n=1 Tax=Microbulbifer sp. (strain ALW1) TaxID=1516059 RepID=UPI00135C19D4|nr:O-antigen ligase family protein [Microbulbifer sp. ALW1]